MLKYKYWFVLKNIIKLDIMLNQLKGSYEELNGGLTGSALVGKF